MSVQVRDIKEELGGLGERMEEMRAVCRQLQSQLKTFPDCSEARFEAEADALMDNWLDVSNSACVFLNILLNLQRKWSKVSPACRAALSVTDVRI